MPRAVAVTWIIVAFIGPGRQRIRYNKRENIIFRLTTKQQSETECGIFTNYMYVYFVFMEEQILFIPNTCKYFVAHQQALTINREW